MKFEQGDKGGSPNPDCILEFDGMKDYHKKLPPHNPGWGIIFPSLGDLVRAVIGEEGELNLDHLLHSDILQLV